MSVALIIVLTALVFWVFSTFTAFRPCIPHTSIALGLCGVALYFRQRQKLGVNLSEDCVLHFYRQPRYWSFILMISAGLVFTLCSTLLTTQKVQAKPQPKRVAQQPIAQPVEEPPAPPMSDTFPALKVTGVVVNGARSSAVINGDTVQLGEYIEGVKLVEVAEDGVVVELDGEHKAFSLGSASTPIEPRPSRGE